MKKAYFNFIAGIIFIIAGVVILVSKWDTSFTSWASAMAIYFGILIIFFSTSFGQAIDKNRKYKLIFGVLLIIVGGIILWLTTGSLSSGNYIRAYGEISIYSGLFFIVFSNKGFLSK